MTDELFEERYLSGRHLYGDDFGPEDLKKWYLTEESGYYSIKSVTDFEYEYARLNYEQGFRHLAGRRFKCALALGCARGDDISAIAGQCDRIIAIEPARSWWKDNIAGCPSTYIPPEISGDIALPDKSVDLAISFGVLHHIPNVSHVIQEMARVMEPGGLYFIREPISSMQDWRKPRPGLTPNERGIPEEWMKRVLQAAGFRFHKALPCLNQIVIQASETLVREPLTARWFPRVDAAFGFLTSWNRHYYRDRWWKKIAPGAVFYFAERI